MNFIYDSCSSLEQKIKCICNCEYQYFLNKINVIGVGFGEKVRNGFCTNQKCIKVFVNIKIPSNQLPYNQLIPSNYKGIPTDVMQTGIITSCSLKKKVRPVIGGYGISAAGDSTIGTAGCLVTNGVSNFLLSTTHVIAGENKYPIGNPIVQPAYKDGGKESTDIIATLYKYVPLRFIEGQEEPINLSDGAIALLTNPNIMSNEINLIGKPTCVKNPILRESVQKVGRTTELTKGVIIGTNATITTNYTFGKRCLFKDFIVTTQMAAEGDSGSILLNENKCALGLLHGKATGISTACRLSTVLEQLGVHLPNN